MSNDPILRVRLNEGYCPEREDEQHCNHWWDGDACHACNFEGDWDQETETLQIPPSLASEVISGD